MAPDAPAVAARLRAAGMPGEAADAGAARLEALEATLRAMPGATRGQVTRYWVPGRVEVLGKHTDYAGGRSLLCAVERGIWLVAAARTDARVRMRDAGPGGGGEVAWDLDPDLAPTAGHWSNYPMTVARRIARNFPAPTGQLRGADIVFASDLPPAAGLSSSSALVVATFLVLAEVNTLASRPEYRDDIRGTEDLAGYLGAIESGQPFGRLAGDAGVGTFGGSEDHTAILCARAGMLVQYAFCPPRLERTIALSEEHRLVIAVSGVSAEKTGAARERYNRASLMMRAVLERWQRATGRDDATVAAAVASAPDAVDRLRAHLRRAGAGGFSPQELLDRLEQFLAESDQIIPAAGDALARRDLDRFGALVDRSQDCAERLLGNQVPETITLAREARRLGAVAASAFGAGFGGSVWALTRAGEAEELRSRWQRAYAARFPERAVHAQFFITRAAPPALRL